MPTPRTLSERRRGRAKHVCAPVFALLCLGLMVGTPVWAQDIPDQETHVTVPVVPALAGSLTAECYLADAFAPFTESLETLPGLGVGLAVGYRVHFDVHGALSLLIRLRGGRSITVDEGTGTIWHTGLEAAFHGRGYNAQFLYAGAGFLVGASVLSWQDRTAPGGVVRDDVIGWMGGVGLETDIGMLWYLDPYLFGEIGAQMWLEYVDLGEVSGFQVTARWALRLDWAMRSWQEPGDDVNDLYHSTRR